MSALVLHMETAMPVLAQLNGIVEQYFAESLASKSPVDGETAQQSRRNHWIAQLPSFVFG